MTAESKGRDLFIVYNRVSGWTGLRYLEEWSGIAKAFDIATGYFEIGALLALDAKWQPLEKIRILMGAETTHRTRKSLLEAVRSRAVEILDQSIEAEKQTNPFLHGVPAILEALRSRQIECRVYDHDKFHAKAYITHAKLEVVGSQALVGSSNFTAPGLTKNIELNIQVQSAREVAQLQEWFEQHWNDASEVTDRHRDHLAPHASLHAVRRLREGAAGVLPRARADRDRVGRDPLEDVSQDRPLSEGGILGAHEDRAPARWRLLCDGVGLGKTFVGLMLIERLVLHEGKRVVLFAPKATKEAVWEPHLREWLPHIGGIGGNADFSNLAVFSHTDLGRDPQHIEDGGWEWTAVDTKHRLHSGMFVAQVVGKSMEPVIPDGAYCLFAAPVTGTRQGKTVLVQLRDATDAEIGERYTVKRYESEETKDADYWRHAMITLKPVNPDFQPIVLSGAEQGQLQVVAELIEVLSGKA